jgi:hypothetical protein
MFCSACEANKTSTNMCCDTYLAIMASGCEGSTVAPADSPLLDGLAAQGSCSRDSSCYSLCPEGQYFNLGVCRRCVPLFACIELLCVFAVHTRRRRVMYVCMYVFYMYICTHTCTLIMYTQVRPSSRNMYLLS